MQVDAFYLEWMGEPLVRAVLAWVNLGTSFEPPAGPTAIVGLTIWTHPDPLLRDGVFPGNLGWQPGLLIGMNWGGPKFGDPLIPRM